MAERRLQHVLLEALRDWSEDWTNRLQGYTSYDEYLPGVWLIFTPGDQILRAGLCLRRTRDVSRSYCLCRGRREGEPYELCRKEIEDLFIPPFRKWVFEEGGLRFVRSCCGLLWIEETVRPSFFPDLRN